MYRKTPKNYKDVSPKKLCGLGEKCSGPCFDIKSGTPCKVYLALQDLGKYEDSIENDSHEQHTI